MTDSKDRILLAHGSGGTMMHSLIKEVIAPTLNMSQLGDAALVGLPSLKGLRLAFTTDSYVVSPLFFPGGNIGDLAVNGTVNDLSMVGAEPVCLSVGIIIEEGLPLETLREVLSSMQRAAQRAKVKIITGDTKVVDRGKCDQLFINTAGVGFVYEDTDLGPHRIKPGDKVLVSGMIGCHGIAVMAERNGLTFDPPVISDSAPLNEITGLILKEKGAVKMMRDPTRGGVATTLKEIALESRLNMEIEETALPVPGGVKGACELLGLDPLYVANEGILIAILSPDRAESILSLIKGLRIGKYAAIIGEVVQPTEGRDSMVIMKTPMGGRRIIDMLAGEQLTRIC